MRISRMMAVVVFGGMVLVTGSAVGQTILYVDDDASLGGDGSSWPTAFKYLQDALAAASNRDEVHVAGGVYKPDQDEGGNVTPGERRETFQLISDVTVYGGYAGLSHPENPDNRDTDVYESILSGDLDSNDAPATSSCSEEHVAVGCDDDACQAAVCAVDPGCCSVEWDDSCVAEAILRSCCGISGNTCANSYHVVTASGTDSTAVLDGFTITSGNATYDAGPPHYASGGGILNDAGDATFTDCTILRNSAHHMVSQGAGMYNLGASPTLIDCEFRENTARGAFTEGGGMYNGESSNPVLLDCRFIDNFSSAAGAGMVNWESDPTLVNCLFESNTAYTPFGGGNLNSGGAMLNNGNNVSGGSSPLLINCVFGGNTAFGGAGMRCSGALGMTTLVNCIFAGNSSVNHGGGVSLVESSATMTNCLFTGNTASTDVAGIGGGGLLALGGVGTLSNCTFVGNSAPLAESGGIRVRGIGSTVTATNCILWGNTGETGTTESDQVSVWFAAGSFSADYTCIQGLTGGLGGVGNTGDNPLFVDADGPDNVAGTADDDARLSEGSPCIDAGQNAAVPPDSSDLDNDGDTTEPTPVDLGGNPRFVDEPTSPDCPQPGANCGTPPLVDMGAYEFTPAVVSVPSDLDGDGDVDVNDFLTFSNCFNGALNPPKPICANLDADLDGDGDVDVNDSLTFSNCFNGALNPPSCP